MGGGGECEGRCVWGVRGDVWEGRGGGGSTAD